MMRNMKRNRSSGQIIIGALVIMLIAGILLVMLFNNGLALREKNRLVNAADAVAYSEGVITARRLNFLAYTNRAMVVNNLAAGHAVNTISWLRYVANTWQGNEDFYEYFIPLFTFRPHLSIRAAMDLGSPLGLDGIVNQLPNEVQRVTDFLTAITNANAALAIAQQNALNTALAVNTSVREAAASQFNGNQVNNPIRVNDPNDLNNTIDLANAIGDNSLANELNRIANGSEDAALQAFVEITNDMSQLEQMTLLGMEQVPSSHWFNARDWRTNGDGQGRTKLFTTTYTDTDWQASDAVTQVDGTTVAYSGAATALELDPDYTHFPGSHAKLADNAAGLPANTVLTRTVLLARDLRAQDIAAPDADPAEQIQGLRSFDKVQHLNDATTPTVLTAYARAEIFYQRPQPLLSDAFNFADIPDGLTEFANLYSPFWQVRLVAVASDY